jgi:hypothetical protein
MREDFIHVAVRNLLKGNNWQMVAGQYPNGSDDELPALNIVDPTVACDRSPDPRRHALDKIVPDVAAYARGIMILAEHKPRYSAEDEQKLENLISTRRADLLLALDALVQCGRVTLATPVNQLVFVPALGFAAGSRYTPNSRFCYFEVRDLNNTNFVGNAVIPAL